MKNRGHYKLILLMTPLEKVSRSRWERMALSAIFHFFGIGHSTAKAKNSSEVAEPERVRSFRAGSLMLKKDITMLHSTIRKAGAEVPVYLW